MVNIKTGARLFAAAVLMVGVAIAQDNSTRQGQTGGTSMGGMMDMMQECRQHCQRTEKAGDTLSKVVTEARQSNDPSKMRAALEQVEKQQSEMREHMSMCMRAMDKMDKMHGDMGGMKHEPGGKKSDAKK